METAADQSMISAQNICFLYSTVLMNSGSHIAVLLALMPLVVIVFWHLNTWHAPIIKKIHIWILSLKISNLPGYIPTQVVILPPKCFLNFPYVLFSKSFYLTFSQVIHLSSFPFTIPNHLSLVGIEQFTQYQEIYNCETIENGLILGLIRRPSEKYIQTNYKRANCQKHERANFRK